MIDGLEITDNFNSLEEYLKHTEILLKYLKDSLLSEAECPEDVLGLDKMLDYEVYFPEFNITTVIGGLRDRRPGLY